MNADPKYKVSLLIIQSTPFCNINCKYCYLPDRDIKGSFPLSYVKILVDNLIVSELLGDQLSVCWHAGEPLVLKPSYYRDFITLFNSNCPSNVKVKFQFQTNATLITQEYCDLIKEFGIEVGISIDGPKFINDINRLDRKNKSTFESVLRGVDLLKANNIRFSVIAVLGRESLNYPKEIFDFFIQFDADSVGFNCEELENLNKNSSLKREHNKNYYSFFNSIYHLNKDKKNTKLPNFRELTTMENFINAPSGGIYNSQVIPFEIISVDHSGGFSTFSPELLGAKSDAFSNFILGNINTGRIVDAIKSDLFRKIHTEITKGVENCEKSCDYFEVCGGGVPSNKFFENGDFASTETMFCILNTMSIADLISDKIYNSLDINVS